MGSNEIAVPSKRVHLTTSWVLISRGKNDFVNEVRAPNVRHNVPNADLLSEEASSKDTESCDVTDTQSRVLEANPVTLSARPLCFTKGTIPAFERTGRIIPICRTYAGRTLSTAISKKGYKLVRHFDQG